MAAYVGYKLLLSPSADSIAKRVVLITGGGAGVGRLTAVSFARHGCDVVLWDISEQGLEETKALVAKAAPKQRCWTQLVDVGDRFKVYAAAEEVARLVAPAHVSILVNNAGIVTGRPLMQTDDAKILATFNVNTLAPFWATKAFLPAMVKARQGHIATVASMAGFGSAPLLVDYGSSKHAAVGFMDGLRKELRMMHGTDVRTSVICPSHINTALFKGFNQGPVPSLSPEQVADAIVDAVRYRREQVVLPKAAADALLLAKGVLSVGQLDTITRWAGLNDVMKRADLTHAEQRLEMMSEKKSKL